MQADNEVNGQPCDNISEKNPYYNELTAMYWAWKNLRRLYPDVKYVGLFHYRRFLAFDEQKYFAVNIMKPSSAISDYRIDAGKVISIIEEGRVILPKPMVFSSTLAGDYCMCHVSDDYRAVKETVRTEYPDYYEDFIDVMERNNKFHPCNMFIMKYDDFVKYCEWLFSLLPLVEHEYLNNKSAYQRRLFMSERLFNVYVYHHKMKAEYFNVYNYDDSVSEKHTSMTVRFLSCLIRFLSCSRNNVIMSMLNLNTVSRFLKKYPPKP